MVFFYLEYSMHIYFIMLYKKWIHLQLKLEKVLYDPGSIEKKPLCTVKGTAFLSHLLNFLVQFLCSNCVKIQILRASNSLSNFTKLVTVKLFSFIDFTIFFHLQWKVYKVWLLRIKKGFKLKAVVTQQVKRYTDVCNQNRCSLHKPYWNRGILNQDYIR